MVNVFEPCLIPTTVILDHHDSYTRNLLVLFARLFSAQNEDQLRMSSSSKQRKWIEKGWQQRVVVINVDTITWDQFVTQILPHVACIILGPGPGNPSKETDFSWPKRLIENFGEKIPILGLCLGHQGLATTFGGSVRKAASPKHGQISAIRISSPSDALFEHVPSNFDAVQFNSLVVNLNDLPKELEVTAWSANEGIDEIMGLRHRTRPLWGVQFHPESICSSYGSTILSNFLSLVLDHHNARQCQPTSLPLPLDVRALTTSYKRGLPNVIPDVPAAPPSYRPWVWEQRTVRLGKGAGRLPTEIFQDLIRGQCELGEVWLDSARPTSAPQFSHLFNPQVTWSHSRPTNTIVVRSCDSSEALTYDLKAPHTFFSTLAIAQGSLKRSTRFLEADLKTFPIGFIGYFGYEMKEVSLPLSQSDATTPSNRTDAEFAFASTLLTYEHETGDWFATALVRLEGDDSTLWGLESSLGVEESDYKSWISGLRVYFERERIKSRTTNLTEKIILPTLVPDLDPDLYIASIEKARQYIASGESYELCQTTQFRTTLPPTLTLDPFPLYQALRESNPAPYSSYFRLPKSNIALLSSSPERYMRINSSGRVEMKPIKGTIARHPTDVEEDERRKISLEKDEKERAENLMIVDLCRNDLLGFCEVESVEVPKLMEVESYQTVHQLVTSVVGQLTPGVNPFEAVGRAFPPGSMTGAPKLRSLKLLDELEGNRARGVYSGVFGYIAVDGTTDFSVVIRTLVINGDELSLGAGGAITYLSDPQKEWDEVLTKKNAVMKCFAA